MWQKRPHLTLLSLTFPMIIANITTPVIGLVDTAVLGHMDGSENLAGASVAALILTQIYWVCGFIRMSATGLSAQALGQKSALASAKVLYQSLATGLLIGLFILLFNQSILAVGIHFAQAEVAVDRVITEYFQIRVWGAPAALMNLALIGWLLGQQRARFVMIVQIIGNLLNAGLDMLFVFGFDWGVAGVASASVMAEYFIFLSSMIYVLQRNKVKPELSWFNFSALKIITQLNSHMLVRNLALQACLVFMTFQGIRLGQQTAAINAILMQFFVLIALGLDAVAYAVEALIGEAKGARSNAAVRFNLRLGLLWSSVFALIYAFGFLIWGDNIVDLLTNQPALREATYQYLPIVFLLPIIAHWCFLLDGVFVGLTRGKAMRDSMLLSAIVIFFPLWFGLNHLGNWALWLAMLGFMAARGISLGIMFSFFSRRDLLIAKGSD